MPRLRKAAGIRRGAELVELALTLPLLMLLILAIAEFAMIGYHKMSLAQGARAGSREASIGGTLATIRSKTRGSCSGLTVTDAQIVVEFNSNDAGTGTWGEVGTMAQRTRYRMDAWCVCVS